jgi:hypothetical protein
VRQSVPGLLLFFVLCNPTEQRAPDPTTGIQDVVRMADAQIAAAVRERIAAQSGSPSLAERMVPRAASEARYSELASDLTALIRERLDVRAPFERRPGAEGRLPRPAEIQAFMDAVVRQAQAAVPWLGGLAGHPAMRQMVLDISTRIVQRAAARSIKFVLASPVEAR